MEKADFRDMALLVALSRHKHFSRAAEECGISQPAFSARLRNMEKTYGMPIVRRGNKFQGFTREGEVLLKWAHRFMADAAGLQQELAGKDGGLGGRLILGSVPTALYFAAKVSAQLRRTHPELVIEIRSLSSTAIRAGLRDYSLDAGLTYAEAAEAGELEILPAYEESYVLVAPADLAPRKTGAASWKEAARLPLCLLSKDMRNRALIDAAFDTVGAHPRPVMESNSFTAALVQVADGVAATILPQGLAEQVVLSDGVVRLKMRDPALVHAIGLARLSAAPETPAALALRHTVENLS